MPREGRPRSVIFYSDAHGVEVFANWLDGLRDSTGRQRILARLRRVEQGNYGDHKHLRDGVLELRMTFGPGYRVYFGEDGSDVVVLLCGGDKRTQQDDVAKAVSYWKEYQGRAKL